MYKIDPQRHASRFIQRVRVANRICLIFAVVMAMSDSTDTYAQTDQKKRDAALSRFSAECNRSSKAYAAELLTRTRSPLTKEQERALDLKSSADCVCHRDLMDKGGTVDNIPITPLKAEQIDKITRLHRISNDSFGVHAAAAIARGHSGAIGINDFIDLQNAFAKAREALAAEKRKDPISTNLYAMLALMCGKQADIDKEREKYKKYAASDEIKSTFSNQTIEWIISDYDGKIIAKFRFYFGSFVGTAGLLKFRPFDIDWIKSELIRHDTEEHCINNNCSRGNSAYDDSIKKYSIQMGNNPIPVKHMFSQIPCERLRIICREGYYLPAQALRWSVAYQIEKGVHIDLLCIHWRLFRTNRIQIFEGRYGVVGAETRICTRVEKTSNGVVLENFEIPFMATSQTYNPMSPQQREGALVRLLPGDQLAANTQTKAPSPLDSLAPGQCAIVQDAGQRMFVCREANGDLRTMGPAQ